jgi:hypothetical protein
MKVKATMADVEDGTLGGCLACGEQQAGVEPDARKLECDGCGEHRVYGLEELMFMGWLELVGDSDEVLEE